MSRTRRTIELLAAVRPQELDAADEERSRRDLATILATPRDVPGPGTDRRVVPGRAPTRLGRAGLAAAAVVAAAVLVPDRRPDGQPSQSANPAASQDAGTRGSVFLLASAKRVRTAAPAAEGAYWYARVRNLVVTTADAFSRQPRGLRFQIRIESTTGSWTPKHRGTTHVVEPADLDDIEITFPTPRTAGPGESPGPSGSTTARRGRQGPGPARHQAGGPGRRVGDADRGRAAAASHRPGRPGGENRSMLHDAGVGVPREKVRHADGSVTVVTRLGKVRVTDHDMFQTVVSWLQSAPLT